MKLAFAFTILILCCLFAALAESWIRKQGRRLRKTSIAGIGR